MDAIPFCPFQASVWVSIMVEKHAMDTIICSGEQSITTPRMSENHYIINHKNAAKYNISQWIVIVETKFQITNY